MGSSTEDSHRKPEFLKGHRSAEYGQRGCAGCLSKAYKNGRRGIFEGTTGESNSNKKEREENPRIIYAFFDRIA